MNTGKDHLLDWLRDAHAMEMAAIDILERQANRIESYPEMLRKVQEHAETSRRQASRVEDCIRQLGGDTSMLKDGAARVMANMSAVMNAASSDEVVKNGIADYAFEHFEIASYRALVAAASELGEIRIADVCREILEEEEEMAFWLEKNLPAVTMQFVERDMAGVQAKR